ncbi:hypothetical protein [Mycolicibacterium hippocampi]|uniref:Uncharacterized protein n=1 Tax=Mycolicibacterium hippocampi TaxID=659824 RepID=A0A7I9ZPC7_9MYCO|nr:hypothetical protein [Mycolicibacterium hippocampi]GFH02516.1 hypothetical protein MHIP_29990 [Mycolicibacterium hippocampi]
MPYAWLGAGAITLGIGAALVGGAGVAHAEDGANDRSTSTSDSNSTSESKRSTPHTAAADGDDAGSSAQQPKNSLPSSRRGRNSEAQQDTDPLPNPSVSLATKSEEADVPITADDQPTPGDFTERSESEATAVDSASASVTAQADDSEASAPVEQRGDRRRSAEEADNVGADDEETAAAPTVTSDVRPTPPADTATSATQWLPAAAPRYEAADDNAGTRAPVPVVAVSETTLDMSLPFSRVALAVHTLLKPFGTLLTELGGLILGTRADPVPPGACRDGVCNPTSDIFLPWVRNEVTVLNLTGRRVTLTDLDTKLPLTYGPQEGFALDNARQVELAFYQGNSYHDNDWTYEGTMKWSDGSTTVTVAVDAGGATASTTNSGIQTVIFDTPQSIGGPSLISLRQTLVLLPAAGTMLTIDSTDPVGQALVASALCKVTGSCTQEVVDEQIRLSAPKQVGNTLFNAGSVISTNRYKVVHEVTKTSGVEENLKVVAGTSLNFALGPLAFQTEIGALVQQKYGHSWSDGFTTESQVDLDVPPGSYGQIYVQYPEYHDYVNMTLTNSGVTITIPNVEYVSLAPSGVIDQDGNPVAVTYTTVDWPIGTGPHPSPDSNSDPTPPETAAVGFESPPDIAAPVPIPAATPKSLFGIIGGYLRDQVDAFRILPNILFAGRAVSSQTIRVVNLTPYAQTLDSITGEYEEDDSPETGFVLQPFQMIYIEVDYNVFQDQEAYVTWTNATGIDASAELKVFNGGSAPRVTCQSAGCMSGSYDRDSAVMYLIYPYATPGRMDVTDDPNLAAAAVDVACAPGYNGSMPGSCGVNATGDTYYNAPTSGPVQQQNNYGSQTNSYYYTVTTTKSESASWAAGGGVKLKEKAGVFVGLQIEIEASVLYNSSVQVKDSESSTVVQNLLPDYGGAIYIGDPYLRTYGDYIVNLPNLTMVVTGQWIEAASGLAAQGPVANVVDYPLS